MFQHRRIKHCRHCGFPVAYQVPADDNRERAVCTSCTEIHYETFQHIGILSLEFHVDKLSRPLL